MKRFGFLLLAAAVAVTIASLGFAAVPRLISYQGTITGTGGPLHGIHDLGFAIYADSTEGVALWTEPHAGVEIDHGLFSVILGRSAPITDVLLAHGELWMGVTVDADPEIAPRMRMTSVQWAMRAALAESCLVSAPDADWAYAGANIYRLTGDVGIGTADPQYSVDIRRTTGNVAVNLKGEDDMSAYLMLADGSGYLRYYEADGELQIWNTAPSQVGGDMAFATADSERLRIKSNGNVGIGLGVPSEKLDVAGTVKATGFSMPTGAASGYVLTSDGSGIGTWQAPTGGGSDGDWTISGNNQYSAVPGNVGIGTTTPGSKLMVLSGGTQCIYARGTDAATIGVVGYNQGSGNEGRLGASDVGAYGLNGSSGNYGYFGGGSLGAYGRNGSSQNYGQLGATLYGVYGYHNASGSYGYLGADTVGVYGYTTSLNHTAVFGLGGGLNADGVKGVHGATQNFGILGGETAGVFGRVFDPAHSGVIGYYQSNIGSLGNGSAGVDGWSPANYGVHGGSTSGYAGYFDGDVHVTGTLTKAHGSFVIDHPLDPQNKILRHMFVESPENLCIYRGKIALDDAGEAIVALPSYFAALTKEEEATVSLTSVGRPFLSGYEWLSGYSSFKVYGEPGREISWVAYADRDDPAARKLTRPVEEGKGPDNKLCDRGKLLNP